MRVGLGAKPVAVPGKKLGIRQQLRMDLQAYYSFIFFMITHPGLLLNFL
jgi:hypothetical protein